METTSIRQAGQTSSAFHKVLRWHFSAVVDKCTNFFRIPSTKIITRRPASADRTARRQFQATGQPVSRTQASDAMTSRLPRWGEVCATQVLPMRVGPFAFRYQGNGATPANILIPLDRQLIALQLCRWEFLYNETLQQTFRPIGLLSKLSKRRQI